MTADCINSIYQYADPDGKTTLKKSINKIEI